MASPDYRGVCSLSLVGLPIAYQYRCNEQKMAPIRRQRQHQLRKPPTKGGNKSGSASSFFGALCKIRNILSILIILLGLRTFFGLLSKATNNVTTNTTTGGGAAPSALGVKGILDESKKGVRGGGPQKTNVDNKPPQPPKISEEHHQIFNEALDKHLEDINKGEHERVPKIISETNKNSETGQSPDDEEPDDHHEVNGESPETNSDTDHHNPHNNEEDPDENRPPDHPEHHGDTESEDKVVIIGDGGDGLHQALHADHSVNKKNTPGEPDPGSDPIHRIVLDKKGTGSTKVAYVKDFNEERTYPKFRLTKENHIDASKQVATAVEETSVKPCIGDWMSKKVDSACTDTDTNHVAYNPVPFQRNWCGTTIGPQTASTISGENGDGGQHCPMDSTITHVFDIQNPPVTDLKTQITAPIIIQAHHEVVLKEEEMETVEQCDIPCKIEIGLTGNLYSIHGETWSIAAPQGDEYANGQTKIERINYRSDQYYATQSFGSSIIRPFFDWNKHNLKTMARQPTNFYASPKAFYRVDTSCTSWSTKRQKYLDAMKRFFPVDSYGKCQHSKDWPSDKDPSKQSDRLDVMSQYKFVLAFDVSSDKDHISDYVWEALMSGSVPVVVGADNVRDHLPKGSYIDAKSFSDWDELAQYVKKLSEDKAEWESYHKWRDDESAFQSIEEKYEFAKASWTCRLCRWAYAKKYGLGWDHYKQQIKAPRIDRQTLCLTSSMAQPEVKLASKPFEELWITKHNDDQQEEMLMPVPAASNNGGECDATMTDISIETEAFKLKRSIALHDGVIDISLTDIEHLGEHKNHEITFRMKFPGIRNSEGASFHNTHTLEKDASKYGRSTTSSMSIQDEFVKVTVLVDWQTDMTSAGEEGVIEIVVLNNQETSDTAADEEENIPRRIRIITEDTSELHDKMTEFFPSSFAKKMTTDFVDPLEIFYADSS